MTRRLLRVVRRALKCCDSGADARAVVFAGSTTPKRAPLSPRRRACATWTVVATLLALAASMPAGAAAGDQRGNPFRGARLYVNPTSDAARQAQAWQSSRPRDAAAIMKIAGQPQAEWLGGWLPDVGGYVRWWISTKLQPQRATAFFVVYDLPQRDCSGRFSAGGARNGGAYRAWIRSVARAIGRYPAIVVIEPDGVPDSACLGPRAQRERMALISFATSTLGRLARTSVYIDAGRSDWQSVATTVRLLRRAGVARARGFALDVTGYATTRKELSYGRAVGRRLKGKHFVVSTSRNGRGPWPRTRVKRWQDLWCNQRDRALGPRPTVRTGERLADAFEWILRPGYSDGYCNGGAKAGTWWAAYALELARNAAY